jgi:putative membrane protein
MTLWLAALPFALLGSCGWLTIPTVGLVAYALLGIESIGVEIENPCVPAISD